MTLLWFLCHGLEKRSSVIIQRNNIEEEASLPSAHVDQLDHAIIYSLKLNYKRVLIYIILSL